MSYINKLNNLRDFLLRSGLKKEAKILKEAYPIIEDGFMHMNDKEEVSPVKEKEFGGYKVDKWYKSLSFLKENVVYISFPKEGQSDEFWNKLGTAFYGEEPPYSFDEDEVKQFGYESMASIENLFKEFPSIEKAIIKLLEKKFPDKSSEELKSYALNDIFIILNEDGYRYGHMVTPRYIGHDFGHKTMDRYDLIYKKELSSIMKYILKFYKSEDDNLYENVHHLKGPFHSEYLEFAALPFFFDIYNRNSDDYYPDIFGNFASGNFSFDVPESITVKNIDYDISDEDIQKVNSTLSDYVEKNRVLFGGDPDNPNSKTISSDFLGRVFLF